jgi:HlyD family secretion protein
MTLSLYEKRNTFIRYLPWLAGLVLLAFAVWYFTRPATLSVQLAKVERGVVEASVSNTRAGTVKACRRAKLAASSGGQIEHLLVKKGQRVKDGQVLLELWDKDLQAQERLAQEQLATAQTQEQQACVQADLAEKEADRARQLREKGFISAEGLDQRISAAKVSRAGCDVARSQIEQADHASLWHAPVCSAWCCARHSMASSPKSAASWENMPRLRRPEFRRCRRST